MKNRPNSSKRRIKKKKKKDLHEAVSIVGPDCVQFLQGKLQCSDNRIKDVSLVLCGETHFDAIDVTRKGGRFHPKDGWILRSNQELNFDPCWKVKLMKESRKLQPLSQAQKWAAEWVEEREDENEPEWHTLHCQLLLLWFPLDTNVNKSNKGKSFIVELRDGDDDSDSDSSHDESKSVLPTQVAQWMHHQISCNSEKRTVEETSLRSTRSVPKVFEWGDLDDEARELNKRRLSEVEIPPQELDSIVDGRKLLRKQENIWTFDDWFSYLQENHQQDDSIDLHLVFEASVPPWEVELERTSDRKIQPAHDIIRCASSDSDPSTLDVFDPSMDGVGSYCDYCYRKFMNQMLAEQQSTTEAGCKDDFVKSTWFHCVDTRDLGCEAACHADSVKIKWLDLLSHAEHSFLFGKESLPYNVEEIQAATSEHHFVPASLMNPELCVLHPLIANGATKQDLQDEGSSSSDDGTNQKLSMGTSLSEELLLESDSKDDHDCDNKDRKVMEENAFDLTFPSFEGFFGLSTDFLYYSPHVKLLFSPFLAKCCKDLQTWEDFFTHLFFGGTISDALGLLDLDASGMYVHIRSPILKEWDFATGQYIWKERDDTEEYITSPFFPHVHYLKAKDSSPPRTWSAHLYSKLASIERCNAASSTQSVPHVKTVAKEARSWTISSIKRASADPKGADDQHCGGEWFQAFLRAAHSDIYEDVDTSDPVVLMQKNYVPSESQGRRKKYNVGRIRIPNTKEMFDEISSFYQDGKSFEAGSKTTSPRVESLAKILIDIWMSSLVDFSTILKVADLVNSSDQNRVVIVLYMGTVHVKNVADFYEQQAGFRKRCFVGKYSWDEHEVKTLKLPSLLWNLSEHKQKI